MLFFVEDQAANGPVRDDSIGLLMILANSIAFAMICLIGAPSPSLIPDPSLTPHPSLIAPSIAFAMIGLIGPSTLTLTLTGA